MHVQIVREVKTCQEFQANSIKRFKFSPSEKEAESCLSCYLKIVIK